MNLRALFLLTFALCCHQLVAAETGYKLAAIEGLPKGLSERISAVLDPKGHSVVGAKGAVFDVWLVKELAVRPSFKPTLSVKYPFTPGQLIGAIRVGQNAGITDFRGEEVAQGVYTLRYGQQPEDGNHVGTSELADFLLAVPAKSDKSPRVIRRAKRLFQRSAKTTNSSHPAIFSLLPAGKPKKSAALEHDKDREFWILNVTGHGKEKGKDVPVPLRLVVIGASEG